MALAPMSYGDYVWPHNPRVYEIEFNRRILCHKVPFGMYTLSDLGRDQRILRGEGEFAGENAYEDFKKLACMFYLKEPKTLIHPIWQAAPAWFVGLRVRNEPKPDYVHYEFEFWECFEGYENKLRKVEKPVEEVAPVERVTHVLRWGDTLWGLAVKNGMTLNQLLALNPQIRNPNVYYVGDVVYLS